MIIFFNNMSVLINFTADSFNRALINKNFQNMETSYLGYMKKKIMNSLMELILTMVLHFLLISIMINLLNMQKITKKT